MAVNDIELAVGQVWKTRDGRLATIVSTNGSCHVDYPVIARLETEGQKSYALDGRFSTTSETNNDLVRYMCNEDQPKKQLDHGWIEWIGGERPVHSNELVRWKLRDGTVPDATAEARSIFWHHSGDSSDIVAYRVVKEASEPRRPDAQPDDGASMFVPGYEKLAAVMAKAYDQAARGKGKDRHANGKPFHEQPMLATCRNLGSIDGMLYQATKKSMEARGLPTRERALAEIYGAINYLAGAAILIEEGIIKGQE